VGLTSKSSSFYRDLYVRKCVFNTNSHVYFRLSHLTGEGGGVGYMRQPCEDDIDKNADDFRVRVCVYPPVK
jgi:hypothetical protein